MKSANKRLHRWYGNQNTKHIDSAYIVSDDRNMQVRDINSRARGAETPKAASHTQGPEPSTLGPL